jgi:hypothetical protein
VGASAAAVGAAAGVDPQAASSNAAITLSANRNLNRMVFSFKHLWANRLGWPEEHLYQLKHTW